jgi:hypothetical protein
MGASQSSATVESINKLVSNVIARNEQHCETRVTLDQSNVEINTGFSFGGSTRLRQYTTIKNECFQDARIQSEIQNAITNAITQTAQSTNEALSLAYSNSEVNTKLRNIVQNDIKMENIQRNYNDIRNKQQNVYINQGTTFFKGISLDQGSDVLMAAVMKTVSESKQLTDVINDIDQQAKSQNKGLLGFVSDIAKFPMYVALGFVLFIVLLIVMGLVIAIVKSKKSNNQPQYQDPYMPPPPEQYPQEQYPQEQYPQEQYPQEPYP